jgi:NitT/TauT family transport system substrate-binding protein
MGASLLLLSACKNNNQNEATSKSDPKFDSHTSTDLFTIRYRPQWTHQAQFAGVYMAQSKGFYKNYGLDVQILPGGPDFPAYESLQNGTTDVTQLFLLTALSRDAEHNNLVNLAQISQKSSLMLVAKKSRGINSVEEMNNKSIGLWRTDFRELSLIFMRQNKLSMNIINVDFTIQLFLNDGIDVMNVMRYNELHQIMQTGLNLDELFTVAFSDVGLNIVEDGLYCTRKFYDAHTTESIKFAEATLDGWMYAINHQEETIDVVLDIMRRHHIPANKPHQAWMLKEMRDVVFHKSKKLGVLREDDFNQARELLKTQGDPVGQQKFISFYSNAN